jgi:NMD protein affecting ribosome stability and mRNA decay
MAETTCNTGVCIICGLPAQALKEFICEDCFKRIFNGSLTKKETLVIIESCPHCHQAGESTQTEIYQLTVFAKA